MCFYNLKQGRSQIPAVIFTALGNLSKYLDGSSLDLPTATQQQSYCLRQRVFSILTVFPESYMYEYVRLSSRFLPDPGIRIAVPVKPQCRVLFVCSTRALCPSLPTRTLGPSVFFCTQRRVCELHPEIWKSSSDFTGGEDLAGTVNREQADRKSGVVVGGSDS